MLGKVKELKLSFEKQIRKDIVNRSWKLLNNCDMWKVMGNEKEWVIRLKDKANLLWFKEINEIISLLEIMYFLKVILSSVLAVRSGTTEKQDFLRTGQLLYDTSSTI